MRFQTRPVFVTAVQFTQQMREVIHFDGGSLPDGMTMVRAYVHPGRREIYSDLFVAEDGRDRPVVHVGDWVVTSDDGKRFVLSDEEMTEKYMPIEAEHEGCAS